MRLLLMGARDDMQVCSVADSPLIPTNEKHLNQNFCVSDVVHNMKVHFEKHLPFMQITMDWFWNQIGWEEEHYTEYLFTNTLASFVSERIIATSKSYYTVGGDILLPLTPHLLYKVLLNLELLSRYYIISFMPITEVPLWNATQVFNTNTYKQLLSHRDIDGQMEYVGVTKMSLEQKYRGTAHDWSLLEFALENLSNIEDFHYIRLKALGHSKGGTLRISQTITDLIILERDLEENYTLGLGGIYFGNNYKMTSGVEAPTLKEKKTRSAVEAPTLKEKKTRHSTLTVRTDSIVSHWNRFHTTTFDTEALISLLPELHSKRDVQIPYPVGLISFQNSCYANVMLQILRSIPLFLNILVSCKCNECGTSKKKNGRRRRLAEFIKVLQRMNYTHEPCININRFMRVMHYSDKDGHEDFHAFYQKLIEASNVQPMNAKALPKNNFMCRNMKNHIHEIFGAQMRTVMSCTKCHKSYFVDQPEPECPMMIFLDWNYFNDALDTAIFLHIKTQQVREWFSSYFGDNRPDLVSDDYKCTQCHRPGGVKLQYVFKQAPRNLCFGLRRRFAFPRKNGDLEHVRLTH